MSTPNLRQLVGEKLKEWLANEVVGKLNYHQINGHVILWFAHLVENPGEWHSRGFM